MARKMTLPEFFMWTHNNPPQPFNPDYNPESVVRYKRYATELGNYEKSLPGSMPDDEYDDLLRAKQRELQKKYDIYVRLGALRDEEFSTLSYCIQCADKKTGNVGNFVHAGDFQALSPVFPDLLTFITWMGYEGVKIGDTGPFSLQKTQICCY